MVSKCNCLVCPELLHWLALKATCSPTSLHIYWAQGFISQECNARKAASKSPWQLWRNRGSILKSDNVSIWLFASFHFLIAYLTKLFLLVLLQRYIFFWVVKYGSLRRWSVWKVSFSFNLKLFFPLQCFFQYFGCCNPLIVVFKLFPA